MTAGDALPPGTAQSFEVSFWSARVTTRQPRVQVFVHVAGAATLVLWVSQHTTVSDVCRALGVGRDGALKDVSRFHGYDNLKTRLARVSTTCRTRF